MLGFGRTGSIVDDAINLEDSDNTYYQLTSSGGLHFPNPSGDGCLSADEYAKQVYSKDINFETSKDVGNFRFDLISSGCHMKGATKRCHDPEYQYEVYLNDKLLDNVNAQFVASCSELIPYSNYVRYYSNDGKIYSSQPDDFEGVKVTFAYLGQTVAGGTQCSNECTAFIVSKYELIGEEEVTPEQTIEDIPSEQQEGNSESSTVKISFVQRFNSWFSGLISKLFGGSA